MNHLKRSGVHLIVYLLLGLVATSVGAAGTCPVNGSDTVVPLTSFDPPPQAGTPELTPDDVIAFIHTNNITTLKGFLDVMPDHMNKNFSLIEETQTPGKSSLEFPRILMFGSDARFMINVPTDPTDADYERLDVSYRHDDGTWEFSQLDFTTSPATLNKNPAVCRDCHGTPARPFWQQYLNWPGVFGDDDSNANAPETLEPRHAQRFRELKNGQGNPDRFHTLLWEDRYEDNRAQHLKDNIYGFAMSIFNMAIASQVAEGVSLRLENHPNWADVRHEFMYSHYCDDRARLAGPEEKSKIAQLIASLGGSGDTIEDFYDALGMDTDQEFKIHWLTTDPVPPSDDYNINTDSFWGVMSGLILDDLRQADPNIKNILLAGPNNHGVFGCPDLGQNTDEVLDYKMLHYYQIRGEARQDVQEAFFDVDISRTHQVVTDQVRTPLCNYLEDNLDTSIPGGGVNLAPRARTNGPFTGEVGVDIAMSSSSSTDADGTIVNRSWDFGDGSASSDISPSHSYAAEGNYTVTLTVTDDDGASDTVATTATVSPAGGGSGVENACATQGPIGGGQLNPGETYCLANNDPLWLYIADVRSHNSIAISTAHGAGDISIEYSNQTWPNGSNADGSSNNAGNQECIYITGGSQYWGYIKVSGSSGGASLVVDYNTAGCRH